MLVDALKSEAYRVSRNRTTLFFSILLTPLLFVFGGLAYQIMTKAKGDALAAKANLPATLGNQPVNLAEAFGFAAGNGANGVLLVFMLLAAAAVYAGDYRWETWRLISARNGRPWLILGKIGVMKVLASSPYWRRSSAGPCWRPCSPPGPWVSPRPSSGDRCCPFSAGSRVTGPRNCCCPAWPMTL